MKLKSLDFTKVSIDDRFWKPRIETNRKVTLPLEYLPRFRINETKIDEKWVTLYRSA